MHRRIGLSAAIGVQNIGNHCGTLFAVCLYPTVGCERCIVDAKEIMVMVRVSRVSVRVRDAVRSLGLGSGLVSGLVVAAVYRPLVIRMSLIFYVLNADSGR